MKKFNKWILPDHEEHLIQWMQQTQREKHGRLVYQSGKYETALSFCKSKRRAIDVGAHIGLLAFMMVHDFEKVECFEPMPAHIACWNENMKDFRNVELHKIALGNTESFVNLQTRTNNSSGDTGIVENIDQYKSNFIQNVVLKPLDSYGFNDVDFIKIDCEGYEHFVIEGALDTIKYCKPVIMVEQKGNMSAQYGLGKKSAVELLKSMGAKVKAELSGDYILSWD